ncbi:unnamed protein product [Symbiodinium sp. CCMP2592]|nr:unnamed protein product [Symbiodinium sp. CCMP2592]
MIAIALATSGRRLGSAKQTQMNRWAVLWLCAVAGLLLCAVAALWLCAVVRADAQEELIQAVLQEDGRRVFDLLYYRQVDISNIRTAEGQTLLHRASVLCSIAILHNLVAFWPDGVQVWETLTDRWPAVVLHVTNNAGNTPQRLCMQSELVEAVRRNNASRVAERLSAGQFDVSSTRTVDEFSPAKGQTLLHEASACCSFDVLRLLVEAWPDGVQVADEFGETPLHSAFEGMFNSNCKWYTHSPLDDVEPLLEAWPEGVSAQDVHGDTPLHYASRECHVNLEVWEMLTDRWPAGVLATNNAGDTPLRLCMQSIQSHMQSELVEAVRRNNASRATELLSGVQVADSNGQVPLHLAVEYGSFDVLRLLVEAWPEGVQVADSNGQVPLHLAVEYGSFDVLRLLVEAWPEGVQVADSNGRVPLHVAFERSVEPCGPSGRDTILVLLEVWPEGLRAADVDGDTPLHFAAGPCWRSETWKILTDSWPADVRAALRVTNNKGDTPLHAVPFRTGDWDYDLLQVVKQVWPDGSMPTVHRLQCELVVAAACNVTAPWFQPSWQEHAVDFNCLSFRQLSKPAVQLWLSCGGYVGWRSPSGIPLWADLDNPDARDFLKAQVSTTTLISAISAALQDVRTWVVPGCVVLVTCAVVALEQKLLQRKRQRASLHSTAKRLDPFQNGAMLLVSRAFSTHGTLWRLWCWLEVYTAIYLFGFALIVAYWAWWLPVVTLAYFIPAVRLRGLRALLRAPALAILSRGFPSQVIALLRTSVLMGIVHFLTAIALQVQAIHGTIINPFHAEWRLHRFGGGHWAPWVGDYQIWGLWDNSSFGPISAAELFMCLYFFSLVVVLSYVVWLALVVVMGCAKRLPGGRGDPEPEDLQEVALQAVKDLLEQSPEQFVEVHSKIKPVVALAWPWQGGGLWLSVAVVMLDVGLDVNTVGTFLLSRDYFFAAVLIFIVVRSTLKQLCVLPLWRLRQASLSL